MMEISGKYNTAKVFTNVIEKSAIAQINEICDQPMTEGLDIRIMPDVHAGAGCTIGTTMTVKDKLVPNFVGVDIGCGMETVKLREKHIELEKMDKVIHERIPSGFDIRYEAHRYCNQIDLTELCCYDKIKAERANLSIGTLGGGNHFIEADKGDDGSIYIVIHSGSRHLGVETAAYYQEKAFFNIARNRDDVKELIEMYKAMGKEKKIEEAIRRLKNTGKDGIPKHLAYCEGELFNQYIHDMKIVQRFALINRQAMMDEIIKGMHLHVVEQFTTIHNYIDTDTMILRKGAVSANAGEKLLIPINMRDGSLICTGKGNPEWNYSAPHGAGRLMSRSEAKQSFTVSELKNQMDGIYTTSVNAATLDECPMAYKSMEDIIDNIGDTVEINEVIKPIYNFKAGDE